MTRSPERWIWWILLLAAIPRLVQITAPPIGHHGWRQADTAAVARNFHEGGYRLFFPEVDWETPGYVDMELPLYPWVASLGYAFAGERIWLARGLAVVASLATVYLLWLLAGWALGREEALWAALVWAILPLTVFFGRAVMPESWMLAASVAGLACFLRWRENGGSRPLLAAAGLIGLAALLKLPALHLGLPLLWLAGERLRSSPRARWQLGAFAALIAVPVVAWYWHAHRLGAATGATFGIFAGPSAKLGRWDLLLEPGFYHRVFLHFFADRLLTWVGFALLLLGLFVARGLGRIRLFDWWFAGAAIGLLLACGGSYYHEYYALPLALPAAGYIGRALAWLRRRSPPAMTLVLIALAGVSVWRSADYFSRERVLPAGESTVAQDLRAGRLLARLTSSSSLVVSCDQTDPTWLYLANRQGFGRACDRMDKRALDVLRARGADFLIARQADFESRPGGLTLRDHLLHTHRVAHDDGELFVVDLAPVAMSRLPSRPLLGLRFDNSTVPQSWRLEGGRWRLEKEGLTIEPVRRQFTAILAPDFAGCGPCGLRLVVAVEPVSRTDRRNVFSVQGWRASDRHTEAVFDLTSGRVTLALIEDGRARVSTSAPLPAWTAGEHSIEVTFDLFEYHVYVDSRLLLSLPAPEPATAFGGIGLTSRNLRVRLRDLTVFAPVGPPSRDAKAGGDAVGDPRHAPDAVSPRRAARLAAGK